MATKDLEQRQDQPNQQPTEQNQTQALQTIETPKENTPPDKMSWQEAASIIQKHFDATKLKEKDRALVRKALDDQPAVWRVAGDMVAQVQGRMLDKMLTQQVAKESIERGLKHMREGLGQKDASPLERMLIDQVVLCWLNMYEVQYKYTVNMSNNLTLAQGSYWEHRLSTVQARYLRAIETLARVRKLMKVVPVQVNLAQQQINVVNGQ